MIAILRFLILYVALTLGQFIWLLNISIRTAYKVGTRQETMFSGRDFSLDENGFPYPFSRLDSWNLLDDSTQIIEILPTVCSPNTDPHCAAYLSPVNTFIESNPDDPGQQGPFFFITYDTPSYVIEFRSGDGLPVALDDTGDPWAYCVNHTTATRASIRMCMGGENRASRQDSWIVNAGWHFCNDTYNCPQVGNQSFGNNVFTTTMFIQKASSSVIISAVNSTIVDISLIKGQTTYNINISEFFTAFSAALMPDISVTIENIHVFNNSGGLDLLYGVGNISNTSTAADQFVESLVFSFDDYATHPVFQLHGFLTYALVKNSWGTNDSVLHSFDQAIQTYALNLNAVSMPAFTIVTVLTLLSCLAMLVVYPRLNPNILSFPEVIFGGKLDASMRNILAGLSNGTSGMVIEKLVDVQIRVGEQIRDGVVNVVISTGEANPLRSNVIYT